MALGSAEGVRRILRKSSDELLDAEISPYLDEVTRWIKAKYYNLFMADSFYTNTIPASGNVNREYSFYFDVTTGTSSEHTVQVWNEGVQLTENTDYTLDRSASTFTFDSNYGLQSGNKIVVFYRPMFFDDYANWETAYRIVIGGSVNLPDGERGMAIRNFIKEQRQEYVKMIEDKPFVAAAVDHMEENDIY